MLEHSRWKYVRAGNQPLGLATCMLHDVSGEDAGAMEVFALLLLIPKQH